MEPEVKRMKQTKLSFGQKEAPPPLAVLLEWGDLESFLPDAWRSLFHTYFQSDEWQDLKEKIEIQSKSHTIYPKKEMVFNVFRLCPLSHIKVVICGQDPYHGPNQACGLSFSVPRGCKIPSSLRNIYKELESDLQIPVAKHGDLTSWAKQGVFLLNATLTVNQSQANSHQSFGWATFTDKVIRHIDKLDESVVFILWGANAQKKCKNIDMKKHHVIKSVHPSGLSAHRGFFGSKPFSQCNVYLQSIGKEPINWALPQ